MLVDDALECAGAHVAANHWHVAEDAQVRVDDDAVVIDAPGVRLRMTMPGSTSRPVLLRGSIEPRGGWVSRRFGCRTPTTQVVWRHAFTGTTQWRTAMSVEATK